MSGKESKAAGKAGINIGYGHVKLRTGERYYQYASVTQPANTAMQGVIGQERNTLKVEIDGTGYEVGAEAALLAGDSDGKAVFERWADSLQYRILKQSVLDLLAQEQTGEWHVVIGMPVSQYLNRQYREELKQLWQRCHETPHGEVNITRAMMVPEPMGAYFYYGSDLDEDKLLSKTTACFLDGGYYTFDWITAANGRLVDSKCDAVNVGAYRLLTELRSRIRQQTGERVGLVPLEAALINQAPVTVAGQEIDLATILPQATEVVAGELIAELRNGLGNVSSISHFFVGGGSGPLFLEAIKTAFPKHRVELLPKPQRANAIGYYYLARTL